MASSSRITDLLLREGIHAAPAPGRPRGWANGPGKRTFDALCAVSACVVAAPVIGVLSAAVKVSSRGPVFFRQTRMGRYGQPFTILKFRTMRQQQDGPLVTARNDARITAVGRVLRRTKLDELPQLFNVVRGEMSFVGPRPKVAEHQPSPLLCRPGLTGAATLAFIDEERLLEDVPEHLLESYATEVLHRIKVDVDREYALRSTLMTDLRLLASTALHLVQVRRSRSVQEMNKRILDARQEVNQPAAEATERHRRVA